MKGCLLYEDFYKIKSQIRVAMLNMNRARRELRAYKAKLQEIEVQLKQGGEEE